MNGLSAVTPAVVDAARESFGDRGPHRRPQAVATTFIAENLTTNNSENDRPAGRDGGSMTDFSRPRDQTEGGEIAAK